MEMRATLRSKARKRRSYHSSGTRPHVARRWSTTADSTSSSVEAKVAPSRSIDPSSLKVSEDRLAALAKERKPLTDEAEFYVGKSLPAKLKAQLDANDAAVEAQKVLVQNQKLELVRIDQNFDADLERLRKLWGGAQPGSLGAPVMLAPVPAAAATAKKK